MPHTTHERTIGDDRFCIEPRLKGGCLGDATVFKLLPSECDKDYVMLKVLEPLPSIFDSELPLRLPAVRKLPLPRRFIKEYVREHQLVPGKTNYDGVLVLTEDCEATDSGWIVKFTSR